MTIKHVLVLDFESHYSKDYSLRTMSVPEYVLDPRFQVHLLAVYDPTWPAPRILEAHEIEDFLRQYPANQTMAIAHNYLFDGAILAWRYGWVPKRMQDTLGMVRSLRNFKRNSLGACAKELFGTDTKGDVLPKLKGLSVQGIKQAGLWPEYKTYAMQDVNLCSLIYFKLLPEFPVEERKVMDLVLRAALQPVLRADVNMLTVHLQELRQRKAMLLRDCGYDKAALMSTALFQAALEDLGVDIERKTSATGKQVPAFAKSDPFMAQLQEYDRSYDDDINFKVQTLATARLAHKSTIEETRVEKFIKIAGLQWMNGCKYPDCDGGPATGYCHENCKQHPALLPVALRYGGAHTHRLSGEFRLNMQNLPRDQSKSKLRTSLLAPPGHKLIAADLAQIECVAEGQLVLTEHGPKAIQNVQLSDRVWDGQEFVSHEGVVFKGIQTVISYQGLTATPEHIVYPAGYQVAEGVSLQMAAALGLDIHTSYAPDAVRQAPLQFSLLRWLQDLWRSRDQVSFQERLGFGFVGVGELATPNLRWGRDRSHQQQWALRARQFEAVDATAERQQPLHHGMGAHAIREENSATGLHTPAPGMWVWPRSNPQPSAKGVYRRTDRAAVQDSLQTQNVGAKAKVYDIVNAGPRHRFMVSGVVVSNCRITAALCGQENLLEQFRNGEDVYANFGTQLFGRTIDKKTAPNERWISKTAVLGLGYGCGAARFYQMVKVSARQYGIPLDDLFDSFKALETVDLYRDTFSHIATSWRMLDGKLQNYINCGNDNQFSTWGPVTFERGRIVLPNRMTLRYMFGDPSLYGAKLLENIVQALARIVIMQTAVRLNERYHLRFVLQSHDELVFAVPDSEVAWLKTVIMDEMVRVPDWLPGLPLAAEIGVGSNYGECK